MITHRFLRHNPGSVTPVGDLRPEARGVNLRVQVIDCEVVAEREDVWVASHASGGRGGVLDFGEADSRVFAESSEHDDGEEGDDGQVPKGADVVHGGRVAEVRIGDASGTILLSCSGGIRACMVVESYL